MTDTLTMDPLRSTARRLDAALPWCGIRVGRPEGDPAYTRCVDVDAAFLAGWESRIAEGLVRAYGASHPLTAAAFALDWYAGIPSRIGGAMFRLARRVPRLDRAALAFACEATTHHPCSIALLDDRFFCLPDDPDSAHPAATVVADDRALADVLRAQVRMHADDFLRDIRPSVRLPRRGLLGAFFDGLDTGVWFGGDPAATAAQVILADAATVLPGATSQFRDASSIYRFADVHDRDHVTRRRVSCCYYFKVSDDGRACSTCPRVSDAERVQRYSELED